jgi:hypothetical protein
MDIERWSVVQDVAFTAELSVASERTRRKYVHDERDTDLVTQSYPETFVCKQPARKCVGLVLWLCRDLHVAFATDLHTLYMFLLLHTHVFHIVLVVEYPKHMVYDVTKVVSI